MAKVEFDYYYGAEAEQFTFVRVPRIFFTDREHFGTLSTDAKILYSLLLERMSLSRKNNWIDEENRVFIIFKIEEIEDKLNCGHEKACNILKELDDENGIGLISKRRRGMGQPAIIYVKNFILKDEEPSESEPRSPETGSQEVGKSEVLTSENQTSIIPKNRLPEVRKSESNYIENNYTEKSYIEDQSIPILSPDPSPCEQEKKRTEAKSPNEVDVYREIIKENISYDILADDRRSDRDRLDEILDIILETVCTARKTIRIAGDEFPAEMVKSKFLKLDSEHIQFVLDCMKENTTKIRNIKQYLRAVLFNAPSTIGNYYTSIVAHDMASRKI